MITLPWFLRPRTRVRTQEDAKHLLRLAEAYQNTFVHPNGEIPPHAALVLQDLANACFYGREDLPANAEQAMVRATGNAVFARVLKLTNLQPNDVIVTTKRTEE